MSSYRSLIASGAAGAPLRRCTCSRVAPEADIEDLKLFRFSTHPKIAPKIEEMKTEITKYNSRLSSPSSRCLSGSTRRAKTPSRCSASGAPTRVRAGLRLRASCCARQLPQLDPAGACLLRAQRHLR